MLRRFLTKRVLIVIAGLIFGVLAAYMVKWGNPANMGICIACFLRDIAGGLGLHRAGVVQYLRPEILGFVLGAFASARAFREFRARGGSSPLIRFLLGAFVMIGALTFLGCPVRAVLRLAGGDLNGITALAGVVVGAAIGVLFLKNGFNLGRSTKTHAAAGWAMPLLLFGVLLLAIFTPGFIFASENGPGAMHAALWISLVVGLFVGVLAQRTRMCFVGGWRDLMMVRDTYLFSGIVAFFIGALIVNAALGYIDWGFVGQPVAHDNHPWNFLGMALVGLAATLLGGCPLRQLILSGEGDTDAGVTVLGLIVGAAIAHNFFTTASPNGIGDNSVVAVIVGLVFCLAVGFLMRERAT
ncbi:MAG: YedE-related selenium metabolism membrane protein [Dehalococcoidia bacterium]|nr:MAG: YedE-related selenium metabolism membrane protein [Dehalococcoidia bacterium]